MAGRPAIPIETHKSRGTYRKDRHAGKAEVPNQQRLGRAPAWFGDAITAEWSRLDGKDDPPAWFAKSLSTEWVRLAKIPHIKASHGAAVQHACLLHLRFLEDAMQLRPMTSSERQVYHSLGMQLCTTPSSGAKIPTTTATKPKLNPWDQF